MYTHFNIARPGSRLHEDYFLDHISSSLQYLKQHVLLPLRCPAFFVVVVVVVVVVFTDLLLSGKQHYDEKLNTSSV